MSNSIGSRLGAYFCYTDDKWRCHGRHQWESPVRYVGAISVPGVLSFEAAGLEEFLIREISPRQNTLGLKRRAH
jgi:hypothetical protein